MNRLMVGLNILSGLSNLNWFYATNFLFDPQKTTQTAVSPLIQ